MADPFDVHEARDAREAFRAQVVARIAPRYNPWLHLAVPALVGAAAFAGAAVTLQRVRPVEWLTVPAMYVLSNATEWRAHKSLLHRRTPGFTRLYDRHTPIHHRVFVTDDMAVRNPREYALVLLPWFGVVLILAATLPVAVALTLAGLRNVAALFVATAAGYVLSYEWLHLAYHLPPTHPIGRLRLVAWLRRHHATHHDPRLMRTWNFNVTVPLWDFVRGTVWRPREGQTSSSG